MDNFSEQLIKRNLTFKDMLLRILIIVSGAAFIAFTVYATLVFGFALLLALGIGVGYLCWWMYGLTKIEYEYIVTNNDLDIDKIIGQRKRKRLITISLNEITQWGEYTGNEHIQVNASVVASDASGKGLWYIVAEHSKHGKIMLVFTPNERTVYTINCGVAFAIRKNIKEPADD